MGIIIMEARYPRFSFNINNITGGTYLLTKFSATGKSQFTVYSDRNPDGEIKYLPTTGFNKVSTKRVDFDMIEISATEYSIHRLCTTLWSNERNVLSGVDLNFLPIWSFENIISFIGYQITERQNVALNRMLKSYSDRWKFPLYQVRT